MQNKPDNWKELTPEQKRTIRLEAWIKSVDEKQFDSPEAKAKYREKITLFKDAVEMKKAPARVPVNIMAGGFAIRRAGLNQKAAMYDRWEEVAEAVIKFNREFDPDTSNMVFFMSGESMELLGVTNMKWPGHGLPDDNTYQALENEYMKADEYDHFLNDPSDFMLRFYLPRQNSALKGLQKMPRFSMEGMGMGGIGRAFLDPDVQEAIETMKKSSELSMKPGMAMAKMMGRMEAMGYPGMGGIGAGSTGIPPFDILGDSLRGARGIMIDMHRCPDKVLAACEKILALMPTPDTPLGGSPLVMLPLHKGDDNHMSRQQFEKFYWPTFRESLLKLINEGLIPIPFAEGTYDSRLDVIDDLPEKSCVWFFDKTDMHKAKDILGGRFCIMGNIPVAMITAGSVEQITGYCKDLIDYCGRGGGFILSPGAQIDRATDEKIRAIINVAREHLPS